MSKAWVFPGNGACGAFACGAAAALAAKEGFPDHFYGISSGSINAFMFSYFGALKASEFWYSIRKFSDVFSPNYFRLLKDDGVFRLSPLLLKSFSNEIAARRYPSTSMTVWTMDIKDGEATKHEILKNQIETSASDIAIASASIPGLVKSHKGRVDSGFRVLCPFKEAIDAGHEEITIISGRPVNGPVPRVKLHVPAAESGYQAIDVALSEILRRDLREMQYRNGILGFKNIAVRMIEPDRSLAGPLDFHLCRELLVAGRKAAFKL